MRRGRRIGGSARKKRERAAVFDEEEEEGIDLRQALAVIYQGDLLLVPATSRVKVLYSRCMLPTGSKGILLLLVGNTHREQRLFWRATKLQPTFTPRWEATFTPGWASHPGVKVGCNFVSRMF